MKFMMPNKLKRLAFNACLIWLQEISYQGGQYRSRRVQFNLTQLRISFQITHVYARDSLLTMNQPAIIMVCFYYQDTLNQLLRALQEQAPQLKGFRIVQHTLVIACILKALALPELLGKIFISLKAIFDVVLRTRDESLLELLRLQCCNGHFNCS